MKHTPGPWLIGEIDEYLGYDGMTAGVRAGPIVLDGCDYGQKRNQNLSDEIAGKMMADARLIAAAPDLLAALQDVAQTLAWVTQGECRGFSDGLLLPSDALDKARTAIAKAEQA